MLNKKPAGRSTTFTAPRILTSQEIVTVDPPYSMWENEAEEEERENWNLWGSPSGSINQI
jgi:hypothetical protein